MVENIHETERESILRAFDRLFDKVALRLGLRCTAEERDEAKRQFAERFHEALELIDTVGSPGIPRSAMQQMEAAIDHIAPSQIAAYVALGPLTLHVQQRLRAIAVKAAEQRLLEHLIGQADDQYGGN